MTKPAMADYYPILARAVSALATNNAQARQELYEHARAVFIAQLHRQDPQLSALESIRHSIAFETAILRVEAESQSMPETLERFADNNIPDDFASLLREPALPTPDSNNSLGVSPPPSHLIPKKFIK
jgi:hypothetical protein